MSKKKQQHKQQQNSSRRTVFVFTTLVGALSATAALLLVLAPAPLTPSSSARLLAVDTAVEQSMDAIFDTRVPVQNNRWHYIYIHQSRTPDGNAMTLSKTFGSVRDHFIICNGDGAGDGEIQVGYRWNQQTSALPARGLASIDQTCISVCLVGDFDHATPTPNQLRRLAQLTTTLQARFKIPARNILLVDQANSPAGTGTYFPAAAFKQQILQ